MKNLIGDYQARQILTLWRMRSHRAAQAHYRQSEASGRQNRRLIVLNALLSLAVLFFTNAQWLKNFMSDQRSSLISQNSIPSDINSVQQIVNALEATPILFVVLTSISGLLLVITTIVQYILNDGDRSSNHKIAASEFSNLQRKIERYLLSEEIEMSAVHNINREYNHITKAFPSVNRKHWKFKQNEQLSANIEKLENKLDTRFFCFEADGEDETPADE